VASIDWGSAPAWASGIITALAFLIAALAYRQQLADRRTDQARRVCCWPVEVVPLRKATERGVQLGHGGGQSVMVRVRNASELPVYEVSVWVRFNYSPDAGSMGSHERVVVPPGDTDVWADWVELPEGGLADDPYVDITFRDASGQRWQRLHDGSFGPDRLSPEGRKAHARPRRRAR
jgi:hypothetical protein